MRNRKLRVSTSLYGITSLYGKLLTNKLPWLIKINMEALEFRVQVRYKNTSKDKHIIMQ